MIKTIFRNTFLIGISILALCAVLFFGIQYTQIKNDTYGALKQEAAYAEQGLLIGGEDYLKTLGDENRVTWIDADGNVLYDSEFQLPMDNEKDHAEVSDAMENGEGRKIRTSENSGESTMYYARKCKDGTILRLSRPISAVQKALIAVRPILWVLILVLVISAVLSFRIAKQIVNPINAIDLERPEINKYPELTPLIDKIQEQKMTIQEEVESREQMRREFSANVSHELKTPLTSISGFAELLSQGVVSDDKVQEFLYKPDQDIFESVEDPTYFIEGNNPLLFFSGTLGNPSFKWVFNSQSDKVAAIINDLAAQIDATSTKNAKYALEQVLINTLAGSTVLQVSYSSKVAKQGTLHKQFYYEFKGSANNDVLNFSYVGPAGKNAEEVNASTNAVTTFPALNQLINFMGQSMRVEAADTRFNLNGIKLVSTADAESWVNLKAN